MTTAATLRSIQDADQDFEWYPTTQRMIDVVAQHIPTRTESIMDIGAGDGRVLVELAKRCEHPPELYAIEKSTVLIQAQPEAITPVGTDLFEQNLACLPVDYIFCNPPYSQFETWACMIIESGFAKKGFLVIPQRWKDSKLIAASLAKRNAIARTIYSDNFLDAERRARAVVDIVEVSYPMDGRHWKKKLDPFDIWFDQNIHTFDQVDDGINDSEYERERKELAKIRHLETIADMVAAYNEEYARMEDNYRAIFKLDYTLLKELNVSKDNVRDGIKAKMAGLKNKYWKLLFERLDTITNRLSTKTKARFLDKLTGRATIAFTSSNVYAVVLWAIKNANKYYDEQLVTLFRDLSTFDGVSNYKSNQKVWEKSQWRYRYYDMDTDPPTHYALDYRFVVEKHYAIFSNSDGYGFGGYHYPGNLHNNCHELIDDIRAVMHNLGFTTGEFGDSRKRQWESGQWQDFRTLDGNGCSVVLFQAKAHKNGNLHFRFMPEAIKALNVEAARLLGWIQTPADVVRELGYTPEEAAKCFGANLQLGPSNVRLLTANATTSEAA